MAIPSRGAVSDPLTERNLQDLRERAASKVELDDAVAGLIGYSVIDAKGDVIAGTADNTVARLAAGSSGQVLTPLSSETTGLKWKYSADTKILNVKDYGTTGTSDDSATINLAIAALNATSMAVLYFPPGTYNIASALTAITASDVAVVGAGVGATRINITAAAGTLGTFFTVGDDSGSSAARCTIKGFELTTANSPSATQMAFHVANYADLDVSDLWMSRPSGLCKLGGTNYASRVRFRNIFGDFATGSAPFIWIRKATGIEFLACNLTAGASTGGSLVHIDAQDNCDEARFVNCSMLATSGKDYGVNLDFTSGQVVNYYFTDCVFDATDTAALYVHASSGANACQNIRFQNIHATPLSGKVIDVNSAGTGKLASLNFEGGHFAVQDVIPATFTGASGITIKGCSWLDDQPATNKATVLSFACDDFTVIGNDFLRSTSGAPNYDYAIKTTADVTRFTVMGNRARTNTGFFNHYAYASLSDANRVILGNFPLAQDSGAPTLQVNQPFDWLRATGSKIITAGQSGDTSPRLEIRSDGQMFWGSGSAGADVKLYRNAADELKTDDAFSATGNITENGARVLTLAGNGLTKTNGTVDFATADTSLTVNANDAAVNTNSSGGLEVSSGVRVKLNGSTLDRSSSGLKVADAGITATQIDSAVAGNGLAGGAGTALSVGVDGSTIEISSDQLRLKDAGTTDTKLASPNNSAYKVIAEHSGRLANDAAAANYMFVEGSNSMVADGATTSAPIHPKLIYLDGSDYAVAGKTAKLRLRTMVASNATAPAITFTFFVWAVTVAGGTDLLSATLGTSITSVTTAHASPSASTVSTQVSSDANFPSAGAFVIGVNTSATLTNNSAVALYARLETRNT